MKGASILVVLFFFLSLSFADDLIYVLPSCFTEAEESNFQEQLAQIDLSLINPTLAIQGADNSLFFSTSPFSLPQRCEEKKEVEGVQWLMDAIPQAIEKFLKERQSEKTEKTIIHGVAYLPNCLFSGSEKSLTPKLKRILKLYEEDIFLSLHVILPPPLSLPISEFGKWETCSKVLGRANCSEHYSDYTHFSLAGTLKNLIASDKVSNSLQAHALSRGNLLRVWFYNESSFLPSALSHDLLYILPSPSPPPEDGINCHDISAVISFPNSPCSSETAIRNDLIAPFSFPPSTSPTQDPPSSSDCLPDISADIKIDNIAADPPSWKSIVPSHHSHPPEHIPIIPSSSFPTTKYYLTFSHLLSHLPSPLSPLAHQHLLHMYKKGGDIDKHVKAYPDIYGEFTPLAVLARFLDFPVIFRDFKGIQGWKAFEKWSNWTYLEKKMTSEEELEKVKVAYSPKAEFSVMFDYDEKSRSLNGVKHRDGPLEVPPPCQRRKEEWEIEEERQEGKNTKEKDEERGEEKESKGHCLPYEKKSFKKEAFFEILKNPQNIQDNPRLHYFQKVPTSLRKDTKPSHHLLRTAEDDTLDLQFLWVSSGGVSTHSHFDMDHNMFVQVVGKKRFYLSPPSQLDNMYMYPRAHPLWHKSKVNFYSPDYDKFPNYKPYQMVAELQEGDILSVPPMWWHHVESLTSSVSLSTMSHEFDIYTLMEGAYNCEYLYERLASFDGTAYALRLFVDMLVYEVVGYQATYTYVNRILSTRYAGVDWYWKEKWDHNRTKMCALPEANGNIPTSTHVYATTRNDAAMAGDQFEFIPPETRDILLMNFIEELILYQLGVEKVVQFLTDCFQEDQTYFVTEASTPLHELWTYK